MNRSCLLVNKLACDCKIFKRFTSSESNFVPVYRLRFIQFFSALNRLKIYQTGLTFVAIPSSIALSNAHIVPPEVVSFAAGLGVSGCITLYGVSLLTSKFIGIIYYDEKNKLAKVSYVDYWGKRKDKIIPTDDIVPLSELPTSPTDYLFKTFRQFSTKETLRFSMDFGDILDKDRFKKVL